MFKRYMKGELVNKYGKKEKNKKIKKQSNIKLADDFRLYSVFIRFKENYYNHKICQ